MKNKTKTVVEQIENPELEDLEIEEDGADDEETEESGEEALDEAGGSRPQSPHARRAALAFASLLRRVDRVRDAFGYWTPEFNSALGMMQETLDTLIEVTFGFEPDYTAPRKKSEPKTIAVGSLVSIREGYVERYSGIGEEVPDRLEVLRMVNPKTALCDFGDGTRAPVKLSHVKLVRC